jgi:LysM repeat protein
MKKLIIAAIIVGTLLFLWSLSADAAKLSGDFVIVEKGDTLSLIAEQYLGSVDKWTYLKDLNNLENPDLISIGQKIRISDLSDIEKQTIAFDISWNYMKRHFKARRGHAFTAEMTRDKAYEEVRLVTISPNDLPTYQVKQKFTKTLTLLEWVDLLDIAEAVKSNVPVYWHVMLMTALGAQESGFRNVPGSHGEIGPFQIKPHTALWLLAGDVPIQDEDEATTVLDIPFNNTWMAYRILQKCGLTEDINSVLPALERYNAGSDRVNYAKRIKCRFDRLMKQYNEEALKALQ